MVTFDTSKEYALLCNTTDVVNGEIVQTMRAIAFADTEEELRQFCTINSYRLKEPYSCILDSGYYITKSSIYTLHFDVKYDDITTKSGCKQKILQKLDDMKQKIDDLSTNYIDVTKLYVGCEIDVPHIEYGTITFICIGIDQDGCGTATLMSKEILELLPFDAMEPENPNEDRQKCGNNRYLYSNILQWLNNDSSNCIDSWYHEQHTADKAPYREYVTCNPYVARAGFLYGFNHEFKSQLVTVDKQTDIPDIDNDKGYLCEFVPSKVFLLSKEEVGIGVDDRSHCYKYFSNFCNSDRSRIAFPSKYCLTNDEGCANQNFKRYYPWTWWLRSPVKDVSTSVYGVDFNGGLASLTAYDGCIGIRVALVVRNLDK